MARQAGLTLLAVGDVFINRPSPASIFDGVRSLLKRADLVLANQEGPVTDRGQPLLGKIEAGGLHIRACLGSIQAEGEAGLSAVTLANNHMMDYGEEGLLQTMELLGKHGISFTGAGASLKEARRPIVTERKGVKIAMLGYTSVYPPAGYAARERCPGVATVKVHTAYQAPENVIYQPGVPAITITVPDAVQMEVMLADIRQARQKADLVVVQFHWGVAQGFGRVLGYMREMGRAAMDAGAGLILGHHPHELLGFELYKGRLICYSLSHFAIDMFVTRRGWLDTVALEATFADGRFKHFAVIPIALAEKSMDISVAKGERWQSIRRALEGLSAEFGTTLTPQGDRLVLGGPTPGTPPSLRAPEVYADNMLPLPYPTSRAEGAAAHLGEYLTN